MIEAIKASAGTGKSFTLVKKIYELIESGISPDRILAFTFTVNAKDELRERLKSAGNVRIETMHSLFYSLMKIAEPNTYDKVLSEIDKENELRRIVKELNISYKLSANKLNIRDIIQFIGLAKNLNILPLGTFRKMLFSKQKPTLFAFEEEKLRNIYEKVAETTQIGYDKKGYLSCKLLAIIDSVYDLYQERREGIDFDDMLLITNQMMQENTNGIRDFAQSRWDYILVDEFQDTNLIQFSIINHMIKQHNNLFLIGDWKQSIYEWRGSDYTLLKNIHQSFGDVKISSLTKTYRNSKEVLRISNIVSNEILGDEIIETASESEGSVSFIGFDTRAEEAEHIVKRVQSLKSQTMFILARSNSQLNFIETLFLKNNIDYYISCQSVFKTQIALDISAILYLIEYPECVMESAWKRVIKIYCGFVNYESVRQFLINKDTRNISNNSDMIKINLLLEVLKYLSSHKNIKFTTFMQEVISLMKYNEYLESCSSRAELAENAESLEMFLSIFEEFTSVKEFIEFYFLKYNTNSKDFSQKIKLLTIHASKGMEADNVYVAGMSKGVFPCKKSILTEEATEGEKRLLYVAVTRARENLYLTYHGTPSEYFTFLQKKSWQLNAVDIY